MRRMSYAQRAVLKLVSECPAISYDDMAARLDLDRTTVRIAVKALEFRGYIAKTAGRGQCPNRYRVLS